MTTPWTVPKDWDGETVAILASGPSMNSAVAEKVRGKCRVIAISNQGIPVQDHCGVVQSAVAPWADVLYASDIKWWNVYADRALKFAGMKLTMYHQSLHASVFSLFASGHAPYDDRPTHIFGGNNSGFAATQVAIKRGAQRILLCGFDMKTVNGKEHNFNRHEGECNVPINGKYKKWIERFEALSSYTPKLGVTILNCTQGSALRCFPKVALEDVAWR